MLGGDVSHPLQLTTGLVIKSITTSPTLAGEHMLFILQVSILSEQTDFLGQNLGVPYYECNPRFHFESD